jgi:hypothetical protein
MMNDAVADELIASSPCVLKDELPAKRDKDRTWRRIAVFTRDEVETIISARETPDDRRVLASLMFLGAMRFGESAALTWRDYDPTCTPLGKLVIEKSYSTKKRKVKGTKTENPREMPVHPTLAKILAAWKLSGFEQLTGRKPRPEDPIVPSRRGAYRNVNASLRRFHEDLERIGLRSRRQHDARRTFISIARADGAVAHTLHFATHGPDGEIMDDYTTLPWSALCAEVAKVRLSIREGRALEMPVAVASGASDVVTAAVTALEPVVMSQEKWRSGRDLNPADASRDDQPSRASAMTTPACAARTAQLDLADPAVFRLLWQQRGSRTDLKTDFKFVLVPPPLLSIQRLQRAPRSVSGFRKRRPGATWCGFLPIRLSATYARVRAYGRAR